MARQENLPRQIPDISRAFDVTEKELSRLIRQVSRRLNLWQGKKPMGVAAALIYKASSESGSPRTQSEVCGVANVSEVTLRGLLRLIDGLLSQLGYVSEQ